MKRATACILLLLAMSVALPACSASFSTANIADAVLAKDVQGNDFDPVGATSTFTTDQPAIHLVVTLKNAPSDTVLKTVWTAIDVGDAAPANTEIDQTEITMDGSGNVHFTLSQPSSGVWPAGRYKVDIYLNGKLDRTLEYQITQP